MNRFLINCTIFSLPIILFFSIPFSIFMLSGEYLSIPKVIQKQQANPNDALYLSGLTTLTDRSYKILSAKYRNPEIIVFGTSRTLTVDSIFFKNPDTFYNAGYNADIMKSSDLSENMDELRNSSNLRLVLFDASDFLSEQGKDNLNTDSGTHNPFSLFITTGWYQIYKYIFTGKISFNKFNSPTSGSNIGILGIMKDIGYRKDGSIDRSGQIFPSKSDISDQISKELINIENEQGAFINENPGFVAEYGKTIPSRNLSDMENFLKICKERGIYVIGYFSPYAMEIYDQMKALSNDYGNVYRSAPKILSDLFEKYNYHFYDIRNLRMIGSSDSELYDSFHPNEKATMKLLMYMADREEMLRSVLNTNYIKQQIY